MPKKRYRNRKTETCLHCREIYRPKESNRNKFCSRECAYALRHELGLAREARIQAEREARAIERLSARRECAACGLLFASMGRWVECPVCRVAKRREVALEKMKAAHAGKRECRHCRAPFAVEYGNKAAFCSDACRELARRKARRRSRKHGSRGVDRHRRRARYWGVPYEPIRLSRVLERDGWMCGICGHAISRAAKYPDDMMPSLDHIIPMSQGGPHAYENVQAAHFSCNTMKGVKTVDESLKLRITIRALATSVRNAPSSTKVAYYIRKFSQPVAS